jgi:hypothetical protein
MARPWLVLDFGLFCNFETLKDCPANNKKDQTAKLWTKGPNCKMTQKGLKRKKRRKDLKIIKKDLRVKSKT